MRGVGEYKQGRTGGLYAAGGETRAAGITSKQTRCDGFRSTVWSVHTATSFQTGGAIAPLVVGLKTNLASRAEIQWREVHLDRRHRKKRMQESYADFRPAGRGTFRRGVRITEI